MTGIGRAEDLPEQTDLVIRNGRVHTGDPHRLRRSPYATAGSPSLAMRRPGCLMLEWQHDWGRTETYDVVMKMVEEHPGAYGRAWRTPARWRRHSKANHASPRAERTTSREGHTAAPLDLLSLSGLKVATHG